MNRRGKKPSKEATNRERVVKGLHQRGLDGCGAKTKSHNKKTHTVETERHGEILTRDVHQHHRDDEGRERKEKAKHKQAGIEGRGFLLQ